MPGEMRGQCGQYTSNIFEPVYRQLYKINRIFGRVSRGSGAPDPAALFGYGDGIISMTDIQLPVNAMEHHIYAGWRPADPVGDHGRVLCGEVKAKLEQPELSGLERAVTVHAALESR
jgi:hypothetical protein